jgi:hypothetical protein
MITAKEYRLYALLEENDIFIEDGYVISPYWETLSPELNKAICYLIIHKGFGWRNKDERRTDF